MRNRQLGSREDIYERVDLHRVSTAVTLRGRPVDDEVATRWWLKASSSGPTRLACPSGTYVVPAQVPSRRPVPAPARPPRAKSTFLGTRHGEPPQKKAQTTKSARSSTPRVNVHGSCQRAATAYFRAHNVKHRRRARSTQHTQASPAARYAYTQPRPDPSAVRT